MRFPPASSVVYALIATLIPFTTAQGTLRDGVYRLENAPVNSPVLVLDLARFDAAAGTPIQAFPDNGGQNQQWRVTTFGSGYTLTAVSPGSHAFVESVSPGVALTGDPNKETTFQFNRVGEDTYQILVGSSRRVFAVQAPADIDQVTIEPLDATNPHQLWRLVSLS